MATIEEYQAAIDLQQHLLHNYRIYRKRAKRHGLYQGHTAAYWDRWVKNLIQSIQDNQKWIEDQGGQPDQAAEEDTGPTLEEYTQTIHSEWRTPPDEHFTKYITDDFLDQIAQQTYGKDDAENIAAGLIRSQSWYGDVFYGIWYHPGMTEQQYMQDFMDVKGLYKRYHGTDMTEDEWKAYIADPQFQGTSDLERYFVIETEVEKQRAAEDRRAAFLQQAQMTKEQRMAAHGWGAGGGQLSAQLEKGAAQVAAFFKQAELASGIQAITSTPKGETKPLTAEPKTKSLKTQLDIEA